MSDYWKDAVGEALDDAQVQATSEQIDTIAGWMQSAYDNYGMAHGHDCIPNPLQTENDRLSKRLKEEQEKVFCLECNGRGSITTYGPHHNATSRCHVCNGEGKHKP